MKVAVIGSWKAEEANDWGLKSQDLFPSACRQIGNAIIRLGHTLVIGSESEGTADRYAVEGAIQATGGSIPDRPRIIILRPNDQRVSFEQLRNDNPGLRLAWQQRSVRSHWFPSGHSEAQPRNCSMYSPSLGIPGQAIYPAKTTLDCCMGGGTNFS
jgi:hypothetical protein